MSPHLLSPHRAELWPIGGQNLSWLANERPHISASPIVTCLGENMLEGTGLIDVMTIAMEVIT